MQIEFKRLEAEDIEKLTRFYCLRHDNTCDSVILDNFLWREYYDVRYSVRDDRAVLWVMTIHGKRYASLPVGRLEDMPKYFKELEQYFNEELGLPLEIYLADEEAVAYLNLPPEPWPARSFIKRRPISTILKRSSGSGPSTGRSAVPTAMRCGSSSTNGVSRKVRRWRGTWTMRWRESTRS